jgi:hypothetical protein
VSSDSVTFVPTCVECKRPWLPDDAERWRTYLLDQPAEVVVLCPPCSEREFGTGA